MYLLNVDNSIIIRYYKIRKNIISFEVSINASYWVCYEFETKKMIYSTDNLYKNKIKF